MLAFKSVPEFLRPMFGQLFGHERNILSAKSFSLRTCLALVYERDFAEMGEIFHRDRERYFTEIGGDISPR